MKLKSISLLMIALLVAMIIPILNIAQDNFRKDSFSSIDAVINAAYKTDYLVGILNLVRSKVGYSSDPSQAIMGTNGWMYLGDKHSKSMSVSRGMLLPPEKNYAIARERRIAIAKLANGISSKGTYFIIAPNKEDIYPEYLPTWAKQNGMINFSNRFLNENDPTLINLRSTMLIAKNKYRNFIYYKTDSHWNDIGAWEAYIEIKKKISIDIPEIKFLSDKDVTLDPYNHGKGGDISAFLFMREFIDEARPSVKLKSLTPITISDAKTGKVIYSGKNTVIDNHMSAITVTSNSALNRMRVLWLRDSFGKSLSPFMASTFSETIQQHWIEVLDDDSKLNEMINTYKPDLVLFTIVGRSYFDIVNNAKAKSVQ